MQLTTMKQKNSTEVPSLKLKLYGKKLEITRHYSANLQRNKIDVTILFTFIYDKRISTVYNLFYDKFFLP